MLAATAIVAGIALIGGTTSRAAGAVLLAAFAASMTYLVRASRQHDFLGGGTAEIAEAT